MADKRKAVTERSVNLWLFDTFTATNNNIQNTYIYIGMYVCIFRIKYVYKNPFKFLKHDKVDIWKQEYGR